MELVNPTGWNAGWLSTTLDDEHLLGAVIVRPTFRLEGESLQAGDAPVWPIEPGGSRTGLGTFGADLPFLNGGVDVLVVGDAVPPGGVARPEMEVRLDLGGRFARRLHVLGDRHWIRAAGTLQPSAPAPFTALPLEWGRAYGGRAAHPLGEQVFPANPGGRGFHLDETEAEGGPLPNIEDPERRITRWDDRPEPVGWAPYPADGALRPLHAARVEGEGASARYRGVAPTFFNQAAPRMILPAAEAPQPGEIVEVIGMRADGRFRCALPDLAFHVDVALGDRRYRFPAHLDQLLLAPTLGALVLSYRAVFRYRMVPRERRSVTLVQAHDAPRTGAAA